jgi:fused signal recognition particle receptor
MSIMARLRDGLRKTRAQIANIVGSHAFDDAFYESLEEALIAADIGMDFSVEIVGRLRKRIVDEAISTPSEAYTTLKQLIAADLHVAKTPDEFPPKPWVILVVGVNGVGKTTTIGKLAYLLRQEGRSVMLGAADTFRAGAIEQLRIWAERSGSDFVAQHANADAASVAFDALEAARSRGTDVLILDTAGRLHVKANLMSELEKILRVVKRQVPTAPNEVLLVIDATTGQNAIRQAETFNKVLGLTGLVITKLDGTAKGGIAVALTTRMGVPIRSIGVGEGIGDLQPFDPTAYVEAMFGDLN